MHAARESQMSAGVHEEYGIAFRVLQGPCDEIQDLPFRFRLAFHEDQLVPYHHGLDRAPDDVRRELLQPSESRSDCPYKGTAGYFTAKVGGRSYEDIVWTYPEPLPEVAGIQGLLSFFNEKVDAIRLDGREMPKPKTKWS